MKRTPLKRKTALKRGTKRMSQVSAKQKELLKIYAVKRKEFLQQEKNLWCPVMFWLKGEKKRLTTDVHHKLKRGKFLLDESTWLAVSREGHDFLHANPSIARAMGWLGSKCEVK